MVNERRTSERDPEQPSNYVHRYVRSNTDRGCMFCGEPRDHFIHPDGTADQPLGDPE